MIKVNNNDDIIELLKENKMVILYFTGSACSACEAIKGKVESILENFKEITYREINGEHNIELAAKYNVFSLPVMLVFIEGKEFLREGRNINLLEFKDHIERYYNMVYR